jgi:putative SOS response-associated peptidase YedK
MKCCRERQQRKKDVVWFALNDDHPPFVLAGIWTEFKGEAAARA